MSERIEYWRAAPEEFRALLALQLSLRAAVDSRVGFARPIGRARGQLSTAVTVAGALTPVKPHSYSDAICSRTESWRDWSKLAA
jgi:hypothetical protein